MLFYRLGGKHTVCSIGALQKQIICFCSSLGVSHNPSKGTGRSWKSPLPCKCVEHPVLFFCSTYSNYTLLWTIHLEYYQPEIKAGLEYENKPKKCSTSKQINKV